MGTRLKEAERWPAESGSCREMVHGRRLPCRCRDRALREGGMGPASSAVAFRNSGTRRRGLRCQCAGLGFWGNSLCLCRRGETAFGGDRCSLLGRITPSPLCPAGCLGPCVPAAWSPRVAEPRGRAGWTIVQPRFPERGTWLLPPAVPPHSAASGPAPATLPRVAATQSKQGGLGGVAKLSGHGRGLGAQGPGPTSLQEEVGGDSRGELMRREVENSREDGPSVPHVSSVTPRT